MSFAYFVLAEHLDGDQRTQLDEELEQLEDGGRRQRIATIAALGGEVRGSAR